MVPKIRTLQALGVQAAVSSGLLLIHRQRGRRTVAEVHAHAHAENYSAHAREATPARRALPTSSIRTYAYAAEASLSPFICAPRETPLC